MTANVQLVANADDFVWIARHLANVPGKVKAQAAGRALRRVEQMARTRIIRRSAERIKAPVGKVRERLRVARLTDNLEFIMRSEWLRLIDLAARQTRAGVSVRLRGSYRSAFIATMASRGVFMREGKARGPVNELYGPNPASDIVNHPDVFLDVLADVLETHLMPRFLHEVDRLLPG